VSALSIMRVRSGIDPLVAALAQADVWAASLAGFLVRGGLVLFLVPIVWLPSPLDLADAFSGAVTSAALGGPNPDLVRLVVVASVAATVAVVAAFWLGALMDVAVAHLAAEALDPTRAAPGAASPDVASPGLGEVGRAFAVRIAAFVPFGAIVAFGAPEVVGATYHELVDPSTLALPLVVRVVGDVPLIVALVAAAWLLGDAVGGIAVRVAIVERRGAAASLIRALALVVRRPVEAFATLVAGSAVVVVLVAPALVATAVLWRAVQFAARGSAPPLVVGAGIVALASLWLGGLVLAGFATAARAMLWSAFAARR
jgi:hypothetical protein